MYSNNVVVTGIGVVTPFVINLLERRVGEKKIAKNHSISLDTLEHGLDRRQLKKMDKFSVIAIHAIRQAFQQANVQIENEKTGLVIGNVFGGWDYVKEQMYALYQGDFSVINAYVATAWFPAAAQGEVSIILGCKGYSKTISADTLSAAFAIEHGIQLIQHKKLEVACCGGVEAPVNSIVENVIHKEVVGLSDAAVFFCLQNKECLSDSSNYKFTIEFLLFSRDISEIEKIYNTHANEINSIIHSGNIQIEHVIFKNNNHKVHRYITEDYIGHTYGADFALDIYLAYYAIGINHKKSLVIRKSHDGQYAAALISKELKVD